MIGNDVVCLATANKSNRLLTTRFLNKVFTSEEQALITESHQPNTVLWQLWAVKESAYKLWIQQGNVRSFMPKHLVCNKRGNQFLVTIKNFSCWAQSNATMNYVYAEATLTNKTVNSECFKLSSLNYNNQSKAVALALKQQVSALYQLNFEKIQIKKSNLNTPHLYYKNQKLPASISLSHHGYYGAYAIVEE